MNLSLDTILTNARELVSRLRRDDAAADSAVNRAQYVQERILGMKQYGDDLAELNDIIAHRPKTTILYNIQKENRLIKQLQQENEELRQLVTEHRSVLEKIMFKYRQDIQRLIVLDQDQSKAKNVFNNGLAQNIQEKSSQIDEMASTMRRAIEIDDNHFASQEERLHELLLENRGLKELLSVHQQIHQLKPTSVTVSSESNNSNSLGSTVSWTQHLVLLVVGTILLTAIVTFLAMVYWCSKQERLKKKRGSATELTSFTANQIQVQTTRPKEIKLFPIIPKLVQPNVSPISAPSLEQIIVPGENLTTDTCSTAGSSSSSTTAAAVASRKLKKKNLLERRGSNNSLTISIAPKHRPINSPPADCPPDEYLRTASRKLTIDELHQHAQDTRSLYHEFWTIPTNHLEKLRICGAGTKNRYGTIIANEHSRVKLTELAGDPLSTYINANYVRGWPNDGHAFIATQGPLANTIIDFYRMIWQERVPVIVMITRLFEKNKAKCERYLPDAQSNQYGPFYVHVESISYETDYEIRRLTIEFENEQRSVEHYWYTAWPDQSCPEVAQPLINLVENVEKSRHELAKENESTGPVVVHCSAGIGRTGCFIALSNGIKQLKEDRFIDIVRILCDLRCDRGGMIQTNDQYQFIYQALSEYARTLTLKTS